MLPNYTVLLFRKKKKSLPVSPPDISPAGMEIWVRLNRFVFGVVAPR